MCLIVFQAMFFTGEGYMILVTNGPLANRWPWYDYIVTAMDCTFLHANITAVVVQFISRYVMICRPEEYARMSIFCRAGRTWIEVSIEYRTKPGCIKRPNQPISFDVSQSVSRAFRLGVGNIIGIEYESSISRD